MCDMEYSPNPTFQMDTEESSPTTATTITSPVVEDPRPENLTVKGAGRSRKSDHSPSPRTPVSEKKNKSWYYSSMYPSYKTRRKEFRSLFSSAGVDSRFVVDYSCAYHKDILHQGRMFVTTLSCCFYSYIFGWENKVVVDWKEVTSITKEKTAIFIPNAVQITTKDNKYFFASFVDRDSSHMMLIRLWQAALADQLLSDEDIDQIIACEYGEGEEDEDGDSDCSQTEDDVDTGEPKLVTTSTSPSTPPPPCPAPTTISPSVQPLLSAWLDKCEGTTVCDKTFPRPLEELYRLLYSNDNFYFNFQKERGTTELEIGDWETVEDSGRNVREVSYNMALNNPVGPKKCQVKETQTLSKDNIENQIYWIETTADNSGVPYADSFSVVTHSCLVDAGNNTARLVARAEIIFKKDLWGFLKDKIETNAWSGIKTYYSSLSLALESYSETAPQQASMQKNQSKMARRNIIKSRRDLPPMATLAWNIITQPLLLYMVMLFLLVTSIINTMVLYRLAYISTPLPPPTPDLPPLPSLPTDQAGWLDLLARQAEQHSLRTSHMRQQLLTATEHIAKAEKSLEELRSGLEAWQPYDWVGEGGNTCINVDGNLICDRIVTLSSTVGSAKDEM